MTIYIKYALTVYLIFLTII